MMRGLIFDFDGLMVDTERPAFDAWSAIYRDHGVHLELEIWVQCVGGGQGLFDPCRHLCELTGKDLDHGALLDDKNDRKRAICATLPALPGVVEVLDQAEVMGLPVAVASSSSTGWVTWHLERLGLLGRIRVIRTREDVSRVKPYPDLYLSAASGLKVHPADCLVLEDSLNGVRAAKAAGAKCVAVPNTVTRVSDFSLADDVVASLEEVKLLELKKLFEVSP